jgi:hypothetical protein
MLEAKLSTMFTFIGLLACTYRNYLLQPLYKAHLVSLVTFTFSQCCISLVSFYPKYIQSLVADSWLLMWSLDPLEYDVHIAHHCVDSTSFKACGCNHLKGQILNNCGCHFCRYCICCRSRCTVSFQPKWSKMTLRLQCGPLSAKGSSGCMWCVAHLAYRRNSVYNHFYTAEKMGLSLELNWNSISFIVGRLYAWSHVSSSGWIRGCFWVRDWQM